MKKSEILITITLSILTLFGTSCNNQESTDTANANISNEEKNTKDDVHSIEIDTAEIDYEFLPPSPIQIAAILKKANMHKYTQLLILQTFFCLCLISRR